MDLVTGLVLIGLLSSLGAFVAGYLLCKTQILSGWLKAPKIQVNVQLDDQMVLSHMRQLGYVTQLEKRKVN